MRRVPKRHRQAQECKDQRRSALNVRLFLRDFCVDFLENCYNHLMYLVKVSCSDNNAFKSIYANGQFYLNNLHMSCKQKSGILHAWVLFMIGLYLKLQCVHFLRKAA